MCRGVGGEEVRRTQKAHVVAVVCICGWDRETIFYNVDNFCNFLFAFPHIKVLLKRVLF